MNYVIGTFAAAPMTLGAMAEFLAWHGKDATKALYAAGQANTDAFVIETNKQLVAAGLPMRVDSLTTVGRHHIGKKKAAAASGGGWSCSCRALRPVL